MNRTLSPLRSPLASPPRDAAHAVPGSAGSAGSEKASETASFTERYLRNGKSGDNKERASVLIRKYANRRLYSTHESVYVTLDDLRQMVKDNVPFQVVDNRTGEDITRIILTQIILESEGGRSAFIPERLLRRMIGAYGDNAYGQILAQYLEVALHYFDQHQSAIGRYVQNSVGSIFPLQQMQEFMRQMQQNLWTSMATVARPSVGGPTPIAPDPHDHVTPQPLQGVNPTARVPVTDKRTQELEERLAVMERRLAAIEHTETQPHNNTINSKTHRLHAPSATTSMLSTPKASKPKRNPR